MQLSHLADGVAERSRGYADGFSHALKHGRERAGHGLHEAKSFAGSRAGLAVGATAVGVLLGVLLNPTRKVAWQSTEALAGDWASVLMAEHRMVQSALERVMQTGPDETGKRAALFKKINWALMKHAAQEETVVYPALRQVATQEEAAKHLYEDHADMKTLLYRLQHMGRDDPQWIAAMRDLRDLVERHIRGEEDEIFPKFRERLSTSESRRLTLDLHREGVRMA